MPANGTLVVDAIFTLPFGLRWGPDILLWDAADVNCSTGPFWTALEYSRSQTDNEHLSWTNTTGAALDCILEVNMRGGTAFDCQGYDLVISGATGSAGLPYCGPSVANSTGQGARMGGFGSEVVADNDLELLAFSLPAGTFGFFLGSRTQGFQQNPGGSDGHLCLGGVIARFVAPGQVSQAVSGSIRIDVDLMAIPEPPAPAAMVQPGETWNFQAWFRDGSSSNFTDGLAITFR